MMETKRDQNEVRKLKSTVDFEVKAAAEAVYIEGFANKATLDRGMEIIATDAWDLENFKKNPVILYNHGMDMVFGSTPVGKATEIRPTDDGLYIKVRLSNSKSPLITMVRDLVEEKILKAFSVGFDAKDSDYKEDGVRVIKQAELYEVSIVGIPMNQDSLFELSGKMLRTKSLDQIGSLICEKKGALEASAIHDALAEKLKADEELKRSELLEQVAEKSGVGIEELRSMLAGDAEIPESVVEAFGDVLGVDIASLKGSGDKKPKKEMDDEEDEDEEDEEKKSLLPPEIRDAIAAVVNELGPDKAVAKALAEFEGDHIEFNRELLMDALTFADEVLQKQADQDNVDSNTVAVQTTKTDDDFGSPYLEAQKQTNVLLGTLINQLQLMNDKLDNVITKQPQDTSEDTDDGIIEDESKGTSGESETLGDTGSEDSKPVDGGPGAKSLLDSYKKRLENIDLRLRNYE